MYYVYVFLGSLVAFLHQSSVLRIQYLSLKYAATGSRVHCLGNGSFTAQVDYQNRYQCFQLVGMKMDFPHKFLHVQLLLLHLHQNSGPFELCPFLCLPRCFHFSVDRRILESLEILETKEGLFQ